MSNASHLLGQARVLFNKKDFEKASETLVRVVKLEPKNHEAFYFLGLSYGYIGNKDKSHEALLRSAELDGNNPDYLGDLGVSFFNQGDKEKALGLMDTAQKMDVNNPYRYSSRAYIKAAIDDVDGAILDYEKCIALDGEDSIAINNLGMLLEKKGRIAEAKGRFEIADELSGGRVTEEELRNRRELGAELQSAKKRKELKTVNEETRKVTSKTEVRLTFSFFSEIVKSVFGNKDTLKEFGVFVKNLLKGKG